MTQPPKLTKDIWAALMLEAIVTEKGVKALLWSLVSSATEGNCFEPPRGQVKLAEHRQASEISGRVTSMG